MRVLLTALAVIGSVTCGAGASGLTGDATATLSPLTLSTEPPWHMKSTGVVAARTAMGIRVRVDQGNVGTQEALNGALIALRADGTTAFALNATTLTDIRVGDHVTFAFDPRTFDPAASSYLAKVIGRVER